MWTAAFWGAVSGSAVFIGAVIALLIKIPKKIIGFIMAFGTGVLIGAAAYELLAESVADGGMLATAVGFIAGAGIFTLLDTWISKKGAADRKRSGDQGAPKGMAIFIGTVMDAIPESIMIGASLLTGQSVSWLLVAAIFISNIPEGLSSTSGLKKSGYTASRICLLWAAVIVISSLSSWGGYFFLAEAPDSILAGIAAFAGGGIIAMISSTMMPEAYEDSGPATGFIASLGLLVSLILNQFSS
ncbi:ZIP family metal transporter [Bacillus massiliglaciei]|uniref:ZIP family metal transporter n=1 Tax=Bacillus massiliglaciei TaxID=1816693 RepID=UPI000A4A7FA6|nr:hypothetical protein [Bacillus massiliglaciei]